MVGRAGGQVVGWSGRRVAGFVYLIRFNKVAIPNNKFQMAKWTRKPLVYRESNNFLIYV